MTARPDRARWAQAGLAAFAEASGRPTPTGPGWPWAEEAITDMITDLLHLAAQAGLSPMKVGGRAIGHWLTETEDNG